MENKNKNNEIAVLGAGRVGKTIALELAQSFKIKAADADEKAIKELSEFANIKTVKSDLSDPKEIKTVIKNSVLVINALPGHLGFRALKSIIETGKPAVDISFFPENPFSLDKLAKKKKVAAIVDCGIAPGMSNIILGHHYEQMKIENFICYVGGLPKARLWPYQYKAPFSPSDVIEEYIRPARMMENGKIISKSALSELEHIEFKKIGTLEAFNTDGLRTLLTTIKIPLMREKTLRYPGHSEYIKVLAETGFFDKKPLDIKGEKIIPLELTAKLLFPLWKLSKNEEEFTVMRIVIEGKEKNRPIRYTYDLYDQYEKETGLTSMARCTGYTATAIANLFLENQIKEKGIIPPEFIGMDKGKFKWIINYLSRKNIVFKIAKKREF